MKKNIKAAVMAALMILCVFFSACSKAKTANTAEAYFTYEDQFRKAGFTKRIQHMYVAGEGKYATPEELKKAVGEPEVTGVVEWDSSGEKCTSYNLDADGNKIGAVTYTFRYNKAKKRIARIGNGYYTDYTYEDGRIMKITRYAGERKPPTRRQLWLPNSNMTPTMSIQSSPLRTIPKAHVFPMITNSPMTTPEN